MPRQARVQIQENVWDMSSDETQKSYYAFCVYRDLLPHQRSLQAVLDRLQPTKTSLKVLQRWSSNYQWKERALAYAKHLETIEIEKQQDELQKQAELWAKRKIEQTEREWLASQELFEKAKLMMQMPIFKREIDDETGKTVIMPARWTYQTVARIFEVASKLGRNAAGMETEKIAVSQDDIDKMSMDELNAFIASRGIVLR